ncbi:MAG: hypothetical protein U0Q16_02360 [Bryobacteraceae bacterium]
MGLVSLRAYSRDRGCSLSSVQRAIERGIIVPERDGLLDAAKANEAWQAWILARQQEGQAGTPLLDAVGELPAIDLEVPIPAPARNLELVKPTPDDEDRPKSPVIPMPVSEAEARRRKEVALARIRELELAEKEGALLPKVAVRDAWVKVLSTIRTGILRLPDKCAQELAGAATPGEVRDILLRECEAVLKGVSHDIGYGDRDTE